MRENRAEVDNLDDALREIEILRRALRHKERDNRVLAHNSEHAERLRLLFEKETALQFLYNDLLLAHTPGMIFLFNEDLEYVLGSAACRRLTCQDQSILLHRPLPLVFSVKVDGRWVEKICRLNSDVLMTRLPIEFNDAIDVEGRELMHARITIGPIVDGDGICRGTIMSVTDVSELIRARHRAEEAAKSKSAFLANMSHEIRTPMNAIKGLSELLALTPLNQTQANYVTNIVSSANSLIGVINDVLDFSKIDANKIELLPAPYSLHKLLSEICGVIGLRAEEKGLEMFTEIDPTIPSRLVGDDARLKQILLNLLSNAVKYTQAGSVTLGVTSAQLPNGRVRLSFAVEDTGIGIKSEDIVTLFDVFARVDLHANRGIQGTGLGLAISRRLAEAMGGDVSMSSVYGRGSVFTLSVPQGVELHLPLAGIEESERIRVLLAGKQPSMRNVGLMLERLGVAAAFLGEFGGDMPDEWFPGDPPVLAPLGDTFLPFTHCIYPETLTKDVIDSLRAHLPECRFAVLRSVINSMEDPASQDAILFNPLLVTELARFLNKSGGRNAHGKSNTETAIGSRLRVRDARALVVDDNRINLMVCEKMLGLYGVEVTTASGGQEALDLCMEGAYDILFVDHMMPGMDGIEVTERIRAHPGPNRATPIVALTANVVNDMRSHYLKCGMDDFVGKPIDRAELSRVLLQWLPPEKITNEAAKGIRHPAT